MTPKLNWKLQIIDCQIIKRTGWWCQPLWKSSGERWSSHSYGLSKCWKSKATWNHLPLILAIDCQVINWTFGLPSNQQSDVEIGKPTICIDHFHRPKRQTIGFPHPSVSLPQGILFFEELKKIRLLQPRLTLAWSLALLISRKRYIATAHSPGLLDGQQIAEAGNPATSANTPDKKELQRRKTFKSSRICDMGQHVNKSPLVYTKTWKITMVWWLNHLFLWLFIPTKLKKH